MKIRKNSDKCDDLHITFALCYFYVILIYVILYYDFSFLLLILILSQLNRFVNVMSSAIYIIRQMIIVEIAKGLIVI